MDYLQNFEVDHQRPTYICLKTTPILFSEKYLYIFSQVMHSHWLYPWKEFQTYAWIGEIA